MASKSIYVGLSCSPHDPAIAIVDDSGKLLFAEATERSLQQKRALNLIPDYYPFVTKIFNEFLDNDSEIVIAKNWSKRHQNKVKIAEALIYCAQPLLNNIRFLESFLARMSFMLRFQNHAFSFCGENLLRETKYRTKPFIMFVEKYRRSFSTAKTLAPRHVKVRHFDHHLCHATVAAFASPFEHADVVVIDGYGEATSTAAFEFQNLGLKKLQWIGRSKNSLGFFYSFVCAACGFNPELGEEWKIMGLAPYGKVVPELYQRFSDLIPLSNGCFCEPNSLFNEQLFYQLSNERNKYVVEDIACTGQQVFEDKVMAFLNTIYASTQNPNLVIVGGCALNSSCNGKIASDTKYKNVYVYCAPADDGTAVGAALQAFLMHHPPFKVNRESFSNPFTGFAIDPMSLQRLIDNSPFHVSLGERQCKVAAYLLSTGKIIGWVQGRAEFGPRALGNRSILADPRISNIKEVINSTLKFRENFRPLAPSILEEFGALVFDNYQHSWYMDKTLKIKEAYHSQIPGVIHVNGTGRLQSVSSRLNPTFHQLIGEFYNLTGIPLILNTSFNVAGKPIVNDLDDITSCLYSSPLDAIFIDGHLFSKQVLHIPII